MNTEQLSFASADGQSAINAILWTPGAGQQPKAVVQLVHGMAEHIMRYEGFAEFLCDNGLAVCGHDHIGHGDSAKSVEDFGHFAVADGERVLVEDVDALRKLVAERYPNLPYFIFGHSMGSFVLRSYLAKYGAGLAGAIICGTGNTPTATSAAGNKLCHLLARIKGPKHRSKLVDGMAAGGYGKKIPDANGPLDWLSHNAENVAAYEQDERCGFMFSVTAYAAVTALTRETSDPACVARYPKDVPLFYIAGSEDPVGDFGKGVREAYQLAADAKVADVSIKLYEGMRHEILNEHGKQVVYDDVLTWINERI